MPDWIRTAATLVVLLILLPIGGWLLMMSVGGVDAQAGLWGGLLLGVVIALVYYSTPAERD